MSLFLLVFFGFLVGVIGAVAIYAAVVHLPGMFAERRLAKRLEDVSASGADETSSDSGESLIMRAASGPLPGVDRLVRRTSTGASLSKVIEQSGCKTTPSAVVVMSLVLALVTTLVARMFIPFWWVPLAIGLLAAGIPTGYLFYRRSARLKKFEEQFPEALDLLSRALRAGHALQTALGMAAEEMKEPVGPEFKKTFDQQNFGLPLRDALNQMTERVPLLDVRFFVTAVLIQRETGGNLSEILENLAHVVRERFKILRQVRVHTAHGRFTAFVLLALPAGLALALSILNPEQMRPLFHEHLGQMMLLFTIVLQTVGFIWIRQVIKIEV
jgi:tight adherence protein B